MYFFDGENISFDASLVIYIYIYIYSTNIPPIMIINRIYEHQNLLSLWLVSFLVGLRTYQHPCIIIFILMYCVVLPLNSPSPIMCQCCWTYALVMFRYVKFPTYQSWVYIWANIRAYTECVKNTWHFLKWNSFLRQCGKIRYIPCPWGFIWAITIWIWPIVGDHHVVQYTPAVTMVRLS
jgi:hypothetical protein